MWDLIAGLKVATARRILRSWEFQARHEQLPPEGLWRIWLLKMGRGSGKSWVESHFLHDQAARYPKHVLFVAGRTLSDVRKTSILLPESGILATMDPDNPCEYKHHLSSLTWANGCRADILSSEEPDSARGPQYAGGVAGELGTWKRTADFRGNTLWDNLRYATRQKLPDGAQAHIVAGTTPRPTEMMFRLVKQALDDDPRVVMTEGTMYDNAENLGAGFIEDIEAEYKGTWLYDQEALGKLLLRVEGAILSPDQLNDSRVATAPEIVRVAIGVDPAGKSKRSSDLTGINASGLGTDGHLYSLANRSCRKTPNGWARDVIDAYWEFGELAGGNAIIVAEDNMGGEMVESTIRGIDSRPRVQRRTASRSKGKRASAILAYYERAEGHIVGSQPALESQLCGFTKTGTWEGSGSPDDADAHVWGARELMLDGSRSTFDDWARINA